MGGDIRVHLQPCFCTWSTCSLSNCRLLTPSSNVPLWHCLSFVTPSCRNVRVRTQNLHSDLGVEARLVLDLSSCSGRLRTFSHILEVYVKTFKAVCLRSQRQREKSRYRSNISATLNSPLSINGPMSTLHNTEARLKQPRFQSQTVSPLLLISPPFALQNHQDSGITQSWLHCCHCHTLQNGAFQACI